MRSNANCGNQVLTLQARHLAIVYQKRGTIAKSAVSKLHFIRLQMATPAAFSQQPPKETPPPRDLLWMRRGIFLAPNRRRHINKVRPLISNFLRLNLAENIAHKCARRTEELEL